MTYKIVADSSCDLNVDLKAKLDLVHVPFKIDVDERTFIDNETMNSIELINAMKASPNPVRTSCPSPGDFAERYMLADNIFVITISGKLSGTYNAALLAKEMVQEEYPNKFIHVFDSKSAGPGETAIANKIQDCIDRKLSNEKIVEEVNLYIENMETYFILENLENLIKNGRISKTKGLLANVLNLKPIMKANDGEIELAENQRGSKKAFKRLVEMLGEVSDTIGQKTIFISHTNAPEKAEDLKQQIIDKYNFTDIVVVATGGLTSSYAYDGGIIVVF